MREALITGLGSVTALGQDTRQFWEKIRSSEDGIEKITLFDPSAYDCQKAGEVNVPEEMRKDGEERANLFLRLSGDEALRDAGLTPADFSEGEASTLVGTAHGSLYDWEKWYQNRDECSIGEDATFSLDELSDKFAANLGLEQSGGLTVSTACTSSAIALGLGLLEIRNGHSEVVVVGGVDVLSEFVLAGFSSVRAVTSSTNKPFDKNRDGLVLGEGAAAVVLESQSHADRRGVQGYCELKGFSSTADAENFTAPDFSGEGTARCIDNALADAGLQPGDVSYINAHGTGTAHNDRVESIALDRVFDDFIPASSIKPFVGHTSGACGVIEAVLCSLCIENSFIPPTLNFEKPGDELSFDIVAGSGRNKKIEGAISLNAAFGGSNACLVFEKN